ncbi:MAG: DUF2225 domain-containing protein [Lachnospiraceae bacterium]|nr:DUF2225 domain-containing protein [Lachnospiraceae bacterium]
MGLLDGLEKLGIKGVDTSNMFEEPEKEEPVKKAPPKVAEKPVFNEEDYVFVKKLECPVCDSPIQSLTVKTGKARLIKMDKDLRQIYDGFEPMKYEPVVCQCCGYSVMNRYFAPLTPSQKKAVLENIGNSFNGKKGETKTTISYPEALENITLCLASAIFKRAKASEKAYICLKGGWLCRSYRESLMASGEDCEIECEELLKKEKEFLNNAYDGFVQARQSEGYPMAGMDEKTIDYLLAVMALERGELEVASKLIAGILQSPSCSPRIKDKAREIKEEIVAKIRSQKS